MHQLDLTEVQNSRFPVMVNPVFLAGLGRAGVPALELANFILTLIKQVLED